MKIDVSGADLPQQCLDMVRNVYNHPNTNSYTKDYIRFELQKIFGRDYDIPTFLKEGD